MHGPAVEAADVVKSLSRPRPDEHGPQMPLSSFCCNARADAGREEAEGQLEAFEIYCAIAQTRRPLKGLLHRVRRDRWVFPSEFGAAGDIDAQGLDGELQKLISGEAGHSLSRCVIDVCALQCHRAGWKAASWKPAATSRSTGRLRTTDGCRTGGAFQEACPCSRGKDPVEPRFPAGIWHVNRRLAERHGI